MLQRAYIEDYIYHKKPKPLIEELKSIIGVFIISPLFMILSFVVYFIVPQEVIRRKMIIQISFKKKMLLKRLIDILGAIVGLILFAPLFIVISILIKMDSKGPILYSQWRIGKNRRKTERRNNLFANFEERRRKERRKIDLHGRPFKLYKFRTMVQESEKNTGPVWSPARDPRVTRIGKILRPLHLDELPQLINILKGDMSIVGPRPERPYFVMDLTRNIPQYRERFRVKPGLTGLAQITTGYDHNVDDVKIKLSYDLQYIKKMDPIYDLGIIIKTFLFVIASNGHNNSEEMPVELQR